MNDLKKYEVFGGTAMNYNTEFPHITTGVGENETLKPVPVRGVALPVNYYAEVTKKESETIDTIAKQQKEPVDLSLGRLWERGY